MATCHDISPQFSSQGNSRCGSAFQAAEIADRLQNKTSELESKIEGLRRLADHLRTYPSVSITRDATEYEDVAVHPWQSDLFLLITWWNELQREAFFARTEGNIPTPAQEEHAKPTALAFSNLMTVLAPALTSDIFRALPDEEAVRKLLGRYQVWTNAVRSMSHEAWPTLERGTLDQMV
jgi:hypothetical protein